MRHALRLALVALVAASAIADEPDKPDVNLTAQQSQVAAKFRELEQLLIQMAELTAPTDPRRASLLRQAVAQSKDRAIDDQLETLIALLKEDRLSTVVKNQGEVKQDLDKLLELLLSEDRSKRIDSEKARIRDYIKRVNKIIQEQKGLQGETAGEGDPKKLADEQGKLGEKTGELAKEIDEKENAGKPAEGAPKDKNDAKGEGKPEGKPGDKSEGKGEGKGEGKPEDKGEGKPEGKGEGKPQGKSEGKGQGQGQGQGEPGEENPNPQPGPQDENPAQKRIAQAEQRMQEAKKKLEEAKRTDATEKQQEAIKELERAVADLEAILRQLREEETARMLAALESRFRKMLEKQIVVYEGTKRVDRVPQAERNRDHEIEAGRLSRQEAELVGEADRALAVLQEDGTSVVFPEAIRDMREDMEQVVVRLAQAKVNDITQGIEQDIIAALEEMIAALVKAQKDREKKPPGQGGGGGDGGDPPLVDAIAELKMVRALQMRVNTRTQRYAEMTKTEQAEQPELLQALDRLAEREQRIHRVTRDIVVGRNK